MEQLSPPSDPGPRSQAGVDQPLPTRNLPEHPHHPLDMTRDETSFFLPITSHHAQKHLTDQTLFLGNPDDSFERAMKGSSGDDESITDEWRARRMILRGRGRGEEAVGLGVPKVDVGTPFKRAGRVGLDDSEVHVSEGDKTPQRNGSQHATLTREGSNPLLHPVLDSTYNHPASVQPGPEPTFAPTITIEPPSKRPSSFTPGTPRRDPNTSSFGLGTPERQGLSMRSPLKQALEEGRALSPRSTPNGSRSRLDKTGEERLQGSPLARTSMRLELVDQAEIGSNQVINDQAGGTLRKQPLGADHSNPREEPMTGRKRKETFFTSPLRSPDARGGKEKDDCAWMRSTSNPNLAALAHEPTGFYPSPRLRAGSSPNLTGLLGGPSLMSPGGRMMDEEGVGNRSGFLPDTPGIRRHAVLLGEEYGLLREDMSFGMVGDETRIVRSEAGREQSLENDKKVEHKDVADRKPMVRREEVEVKMDETKMDDTICLDMGMKSYVDLMADNGDDMRAALDKVDMTIIGDETRAGDERVRLAVPSVSRRKGMGLGGVAMSPVMEVPTPVQNAQGGGVQPTGHNLKVPPPPPRFQSALPSGTDTLDLKFALQCMPKDMYGVGKDGKPEWKGDISVSELLKEDNPFIATAEEKERASRRSRQDGQPKFLTSPLKAAGSSRQVPGQSLRNIFETGPSESNIASPTDRREEREPLNEVERELEVWSKDAVDSRLRFKLDPTLSVEGKKRIDQQAKGDEMRGAKLQAWEDAKRWMFVLDNLAWVKKMDAAGLFKPDQLERVLKIVYDEAPTESGPGVRCPATPTFVRDARRLYPAAPTGRTHRRSASMDPVQLGLGAGSRVRSSTAAAPIGHRRNVSMDPATAMSSSSAAGRATIRTTSRTTSEVPKPGSMGSGISRYGNVAARTSSISKRTSPIKPTSTLPTAREPIKPRSTADPTLRQSRTRTTGTSADQVLASMGIREPTREVRRPTTSTLTSRASSTSSGVVTRTRTTTTVTMGQRATTTASSVMSGGRAESSVAASAVRTRMTQPSASGLTGRSSVGDPLGLGGNKLATRTRPGAVSSTGLAVARGTLGVRMTTTRARE